MQYRIIQYAISKSIIIIIIIVLLLVYIYIYSNIVYHSITSYDIL